MMTSIGSSFRERSLADAGQAGIGSRCLAGWASRAGVDGLLLPTILFHGPSTEES
jgi:hypothetical protein